MMKMICISQKSSPDQESENTMCSWCCDLGFKKIWIIITRSLRGRLTTKCTWIYISETGLGSLSFILPQRIFPSAAEKLTTATVHLSSILFVLKRKRERERNEEEWEKGHWCFLLVLTYLVILKVRQVRRNRRWKPSSNRLHPGTAFERISSPTLDGGSNLCCLPLTQCGGNLIPHVLYSRPPVQMDAFYVLSQTVFIWGTRHQSSIYV